MQSQRPSGAWLLSVVLTAFALLTANASTSNGREFSGYFDVSHVQEQGDTYRSPFISSSSIMEKPTPRRDCDADSTRLPP